MGEKQKDSDTHKHLADARSTLGAQSAGHALVSQTLNGLGTLLDDDTVDDGNVVVDDATAHRLA